MAVNQYPLAPLFLPDNDEHLRLVSTYLNNTISGKLNSTGTITLTASSTTTTLTDARIGVNSVILFMPVTANGATAKANLYVSARADGSATLTHASSANSDQNFEYVIIG
jgi:hypothetical protein|tara:strand:- start:121 stop:450 length:330 start_codon:yes stop_codon:yes gene_type:complete